MTAEPQFAPERILESLIANGVDFVVVGGFAVAAHGVIRATADLDIVVDRDWANAERLAAALAELRATSEVEPGVELTQELLVRRADRRLRTELGALHLLHEVDGVPDYAALQPPVRIQLGDLQVPVCSLDHLRAMKTAAGRDKDQFDLAELDAVDGES